MNMNQWQIPMFQLLMMQQHYQMWQDPFQQWLLQNQQYLQQQNQQMQFQQIRQLQSQQRTNEILPRGKPDETISMGKGQNIINVTMKASTGHKVIIAANADTTIKNLLKMYIKRIGLSLDVIGKDIMFLYNCVQLDYNSQQSIGSMLGNTANIIVYDKNGIIGA